jgi:hypothetical protein
MRLRASLPDSPPPIPIPSPYSDDLRLPYSLMYSLMASCQTVDGGAELVCRLNLSRMELFKYMKVGQAAVPRCRHHTVATRRL